MEKRPPARLTVVFFPTVDHFFFFPVPLEVFACSHVDGARANVDVEV